MWIIILVCIVYSGFDPNILFDQFSNFQSHLPSAFGGSGSAFNALRSLTGVGSSGFSDQPREYHHYQESGGLGAKQQAGYG